MEGKPFYILNKGGIRGSQDKNVYCPADATIERVFAPEKMKGEPLNIF